MVKTSFIYSSYQVGRSSSFSFTLNDKIANAPILKIHCDLCGEILVSLIKDFRIILFFKMIALNIFGFIRWNTHMISLSVFVSFQRWQNIDPHSTCGFFLFWASILVYAIGSNHMSFCNGHLIHFRLQMHINEDKGSPSKTNITIPTISIMNVRENLKN